jgi:hypothetical protein
VRYDSRARPPIREEELEMADDGKAPRAGRVLRFTVTSALAVAPIAGCSKTVEPQEPLHINTGPTAVPTYSINPGPDDVKPAPTPVLPVANPMPMRLDDAGAPAATAAPSGEKPASPKAP